MSNYEHPVYVPKPNQPKQPPAEVENLARTYCNLRQDCVEMEELLAADPPALADKDRKRLDKAVTVMKVSFKLVAKVLRKHGYDTSRHREQTVVAISKAA